MYHFFCLNGVHIYLYLKWRKNVEILFSGYADVVLLEKMKHLKQKQHL